MIKNPITRVQTHLDPVDVCWWCAILFCKPGMWDDVLFSLHHPTGAEIAIGIRHEHACCGTSNYT